jgi:subtilisin-like proprotein convertase family protein
VSIDINKCINVTSIEHVVANISYSSHRRGDVKITLISPSKTPSEMLSFRDNDATDEGIEYFPFMSVHHWGESPIGRWTLRMETREPQQSKSKKTATEDTGELSHFGLRLFGSNDPDKKNNLGREKRNENIAYVPTQNELQSVYKRELAMRESPHIMKKRDYENLEKQRQVQNQKKSEIQEDQSIFGLFRRAFHF